MEKNNKLLFFGAILGASLIIASFIISGTIINIKESNIVSVSGSAKEQVTSDLARWTGNFSRSVFEEQLKEGYAQMKEDEKKVNDFLISQGFLGKFEISPIFMNEVYKYDASSSKEYNLTQNIEIKSDDVEKIKELAKNSEKLAEQGIIFSANSVEYYYSKLPENRISLLPEAIKDAKMRADAIAKSSGKKTGKIKSVSMGVVQVMPVGAIEVSDYGLYDTSGIEKEIMVTVKASFDLK